MTDETFTLVSTQRERKQAAAGARHRKCGSRSKKCGLPSDTMTQAQLKKLNGPVESICLALPMTYEELIQVNPELQFMYLSHLVDDLGARRVDLLEMLGTGMYDLKKLLDNLPDKLNFRKGRPLATEKWLAFIGKKQEPEPIPQDEEPKTSTIGEPIEVHPEDLSYPEQKHPAVITSGSFTLYGQPIDVMLFLHKLLDPSDYRSFTISFS